MEDIPSLEFVRNYQQKDDDASLDKYHYNILCITCLVFNALPASIKKQCRFSKPESKEMCSTYVKLDRMRRKDRLNGVYFKPLSGMVSTDIGHGFWGFEFCRHNMYELQIFQENIQTMNFATQKIIQNYNSNDTLYNIHVWRVNDDICPPLKGFYLDEQIESSWQRVCKQNNIFDDGSFQEFLKLGAS